MTASASKDLGREASRLRDGDITINQFRAGQGLPPVEPVRPTTLEGAIDVVRHDDGRLEILDAPPLIRISLEFLCAADPVTVKASGRNLTFGGQVRYEVTGWDSFSSAFVAKLVEDRRP